MKPTDFARWVDTARDAGADRLTIKRAKKSGATTADLFLAEPIEGFDVEGTLARMRDDVHQSRRLGTAIFELDATQGEAEVSVMRERLTVSRDDDAVDLGGDNAYAKVASLLGSQLNSMARAVIDSNASTRMVVGDMREILAKLTEQHSSTLETMFEFAQMKQSEAALIKASEDRREIGKTAIQELGPIVGATLAKLGKTSGPAIVSFLGSLTPDQMKTIQGALRPDQQGALGAIWEAVAKERDDATKGTGG